MSVFYSDLKIVCVIDGPIFCHTVRLEIWVGVYRYLNFKLILYLLLAETFAKRCRVADEYHCAMNTYRLREC